MGPLGLFSGANLLLVLRRVMGKGFHRLHQLPSGDLNGIPGKYPLNWWIVHCHVLGPAYRLENSRNREC